jgi:4'-phosphopantetheinyl transferase EntD
MVEPPARSATPDGVPSAFDGLLVEGAAVAETRAPYVCLSGLLPEEETIIAGAVENRRREFAAGRNCARLALGKLGIPPTAIGTGIFREPLFPLGVAGSITHTREYCAAAVTWTGAALTIGIDAELNRPLDRSVANLILSQDERRMAPAFGNACNLDALIFSIKEAFFKAFFPLCRQYLDFADAVVVLSSTDRSFRLRLVRADMAAILGRAKILGRYNFDSQYVYAAVSLLSP